MQQVLARFQLGKWIWVAKDFLTAEGAEDEGRGKKRNAKTQRGKDAEEEREEEKYCRVPCSHGARWA